MRLLLAGAVVATAALLPGSASAQPENCVTKPQSCYVCVMYPCYPQDWPPFLIDTIKDQLPPA